MIYIIFILLELVTIVAISKYGIGSLLRWFRDRVANHLATTDFINGKEVFTKSSIKIPERVDKKLEKIRCDAIVQAILIGDRAKELNWITALMSLLEAAIFGAVTFLLFRNSFFRVNSELLDAFKVFGSFLGGWLAIKVLSTHQAWSDAFAGKAYYYISLLGTILNISLGSIAGYIFYRFTYFCF